MHREQPNRTNNNYKEELIWSYMYYRSLAGWESWWKHGTKDILVKTHKKGGEVSDLYANKLYNTDNIHYPEYRNLVATILVQLKEIRIKEKQFWNLL